ncbi:hypothetical protein L873DRAFT_1923148 [Choiromyces venosus 120613-1]|uniref:Uncharacterized protein n=1 Tax=Choiromyces venosus 120613-1 TaxID=1336337 RepID=A0A3N4JI19_9PEZI|nr:hypothetical protein L873DRAFT_1923148 [Choiromyces venosus 120613-1]
MNTHQISPAHVNTNYAPRGQQCNTISRLSSIKKNSPNPLSRLATNNFTPPPPPPQKCPPSPLSSEPPSQDSPPKPATFKNACTTTYMPLMPAPHPAPLTRPCSRSTTSSFAT